MSKNWYKNNKEKSKARSTQWRKDNPERTKEMGRISDRKRYPKRREAQVLYLREYRKKNKDRLNEFDRNRYANDPERRYKKERYLSGSSSQSARKHLYHMSPEEYEWRVEKQGNRCALCGRKERAICKSTGRPYALAVDHDHETSKNRDLLCAHCNTALGLLDENLNLLRKAIQYLRKHKGVN